MIDDSMDSLICTVNVDLLYDNQQVLDLELLEETEQENNWRQYIMLKDSNWEGIST